MTRRQWRARGVLVALICAPAMMLPQSPWTVTIRPSLDPLPIGLCGAVQIALVDANGNARPRNPAGYLMGIADFDMSVAATDAGAVVGQQNDASHWAVCAYQAGTAGTVATITAAYPAQRLLPNARAPGVAFQTTETVTLSASKGGVDPPGCAAAKASAVVAGGQPVLMMPAASAGVKKTAVVPRGGSTTPPISAAPPGRQPTQALLVGIPPTGVSVSGPPLSPHVVWTAAPNAVRYSVWRSDDGRVSTERSGAAVTVTEFYEGVADPRITYRYTVFAHYADGTSGEATAVTFITPPMVSPSVFTVTPKTMGLDILPADSRCTLD